MKKTTTFAALSVSRGEDSARYERPLGEATFNHEEDGEERNSVQKHLKRPRTRRPRTGGSAT